MASYLDTVLSKNPVFFFRCDDSIGSTVMVDASPNEYDGEYFSGATFGLASPIETDPASKAIFGAVGKLTIADGPDSDVRDNFTMMGWGYASSGLLAGTGVVLCRAGQFGLGGTSAIGFNGSGTAYAVLSVGGSDYALSYGVNLDTWYFLALTRNAGVMRFYINGVLRAQRTDLALGDISADNWGSDGWYVGTSQSADVWHGAGTDEAAVCPTALSAGDIQEIYEAALATLPLRATIVLNFSVELNTDQITPVDFPFAHNFSETFGSGYTPIVEEFEYRTNVNKSEPDFEQRVGARPHGPLRSFQYHLSPKAGAARNKFQEILYHPGEFYALPIWRDVGLTTAQANSGTSSISCDTTLRDYEPLSYCGVCIDPTDPATYQFFQIVSISDTDLTLGSTIGTTIPSGSYVFPARVTSISDDLSITSFAQDHEDSTIRFDIIESEISERIATAFTPSVTYKSIEVFTQESARVPFLDERPYTMERRLQMRGRDYSYARDTGAPQTFPVRFLFKTRAELSAFYGWLDYRCGKLNPLWISTNENDLIKVSQPASGTLKIQAGYANYSLHHARRDVQLTYSDGTLINSRISAVVSNGDGTENISILPLPSGTVSKISFLKFCVLAQDKIKIVHHKGGVSECSLSLRELLTSPS